MPHHTTTASGAPASGASASEGGESHAQSRHSTRRSQRSASRGDGRATANSRYTGDGRLRAVGGDEQRAPTSDKFQDGGTQRSHRTNLALNVAGGGRGVTGVSGGGSIQTINGVTSPVFQIPVQFVPAADGSSASLQIPVNASMMGEQRHSPFATPINGRLVGSLPRTAVSGGRRSARGGSADRLHVHGDEASGDDEEEASNRGDRRQQTAASNRSRVTQRTSATTSGDADVGGEDENAKTEATARQRARSVPRRSLARAPLTPTIADCSAESRLCASNAIGGRRCPRLVVGGPSKTQHSPLSSRRRPTAANGRHATCHKRDERERETRPNRRSCRRRRRSPRSPLGGERAQNADVTSERRL